LQAAALRLVERLRQARERLQQRVLARLLGVHLGDLLLRRRRRGLVRRLRPGDALALHLPVETLGRTLGSQAMVGVVLRDLEGERRAQ
jgi:hypothetical protein